MLNLIVVIIVKIIYLSTVYNKSLTNHVGTETSGDFRELLTRVCSGERGSSGFVNLPQAKADAQRLYEAGEKRLGTDEAIFTKLFAQSSFEHLRQVFEEYKAVSGNTIEQALKHEMSGDLKKALDTIGWYFVIILILLYNIVFFYYQLNLFNQDPRIMPDVCSNLWTVWVLMIKH